MTYRLKRDPDSIAKARSILTPDLGDEAWTLPDEKIVRYAEAMLNSMAGSAANISRQLRPIGREIYKSRRGRLLGKLLGTYPPPPVNEYERLHELTEQA